MTLKELLDLFKKYEKDDAHDKTLEIVAVSNDKSNPAYFRINDVVHNLKTNEIELRS